MNEVTALIDRWADAEKRGDTTGIAHLTTDDFTAVGPRGFVLDRAAWLARYDSGALRHNAFTVSGPQIRDYGRTAVVVAEQQQDSRYGDHDASGRFTVTLVVVRPERDDDWRLAGIHLSPKGA